MSDRGTEDQVVAAPMPYVINGKECLAAPLTDLDIAKLDKWCQAQMINAAHEAIREGDYTKAERDELLSVAMREAYAITWYSKQGAQVMTTVRGISRLIYQSLQKHNPEVTHEQVIAHFRSNAARIEEARRMFDHLNTNPSDSLTTGQTTASEQAPAA